MSEQGQFITEFVRSLQREIRLDSSLSITELHRFNKAVVEVEASLKSLQTMWPDGILVTNLNEKRFERRDYCIFQLDSVRLFYHRQYPSHQERINFHVETGTLTVDGNIRGEDYLETWSRAVDEVARSVASGQAFLFTKQVRKNV